MFLEKRKKYCYIIRTNLFFKFVLKWLDSVGKLGYISEVLYSSNRLPTVGSRCIGLDQPTTAGFPMPNSVNCQRIYCPVYQRITCIHHREVRVRNYNYPLIRKWNIMSPLAWIFKPTNFQNFAKPKKIEKVHLQKEFSSIKKSGYTAAAQLDGNYVNLLKGGR